MDLSTHLLNNPDYFKRVNESVATLQANFDDIKTFLDKPLTDDNFNSAFRLFLDIFDIIPLPKIKLPILQIVRGRPHYPDDPLFTDRWQVSYNWRFQHKIPLGRFNRQAEPLFYGSIPISKQMDYVLSCALECCKELSIKYSTIDVQDITLSGWIIEKPFDVIILCFDDLHLQSNPELKIAIESFLKTIHEHFSIDAANLIENILRYFSELSRTITNKNEAYQILAPFFVALRYYSKTYNKEAIYGMIYPSAMSIAVGLNIVLTRNAVKQFLRLDKILMYRYRLIPERDIWIGDICSDIIKVKGHKFKITGYNPPIEY